MHSSPCSASARTSALPWPMPPVKITASSPPIDGDIGADVFAHAIAIRLEREQRARLPLVGGLEDLAHVARNAGQAEQAALLVEHLLDLRRTSCFSVAFEEGEHTRHPRRRSACP